MRSTALPAEKPRGNTKEEVDKMTGIRDNLADRQTDRQTDRYLSLDATNCIKGIFAIVVIIHHLYQRTDIVPYRTLCVLLQFMGYLSTATFFFLSGYGIAASTQRKGEGYLSSFASKRIFPLYVNNIILVFVYGLLALLIEEQFPVRKFVTSFFWGGTVISHGWYIQTILVFYILCALTFRLAGTEKFLLVFTAFIAGYCGVCILLKLSSTWYEAVFAMPFGMWWCHHKERIVFRLKKRYLWMLASCFFVFSVFFVGFGVCDNSGIKLLLKMLSAVIFTAFVAIAVYKIPVSCKVTRLLGGYFFEIYALQGIAMRLLRSGRIYVENDWTYCALCLMGTAVLSVASHPVFSAINKKFKKV